MSKTFPHYRRVHKLQQTRLNSQIPTWKHARLWNTTQHKKSSPWPEVLMSFVSSLTALPHWLFYYSSNMQSTVLPQVGYTCCSFYLMEYSFPRTCRAPWFHSHLLKCCFPKTLWLKKSPTGICSHSTTLHELALLHFSEMTFCIHFFTCLVSISATKI